MEEKTLSSFEQLSSVAQSLNKASDELTKVVGVLDKALQRLGIGLAVWVLVVNWAGDDGSYDCEQVGYAKVDGIWRIAIRNIVGHEQSQDEDEVRNIWAFNDAPREIRLRAVEKLPKLVDELTNAAIRTTEAVNQKLAQTKDFAASIGILQPNTLKEKK